MGLKFSIETIEKSDKILESQKNELKEVERQSGQGCSSEWKERMEKIIALVKKNISVNKGIKKKMELKVRCVKKELEKRNMQTKKKIIETRCRNNNVLSSSSQRLKRKLNESVESVIDCGMIRKVSAKEEGVMVMRELMKEENPCDNTFECNFCPKVFTSAGPLTAHLLNHTSGNNKHQGGAVQVCPVPQEVSYHGHETDPREEALATERVGSMRSLSEVLQKC